ncbi:MAG: AMP-binding protein [Myxococcales bacterium]|jgi:long-chain acyl-CoA synthetase|nr:AMP-binding protein [Myxococcales bacterium]
MTSHNGTSRVGADHAPLSRRPAEASALPPLDLERVFEGSRLLVLGGTGFLGKIYWCMLLDRFPNLGKIFLLVRSSAKQTSDERFWADVATSEALKPLRDRWGDGYVDMLREKIVPIDGDVGRPLCGISESFIREQRGTIDAVVNVAGVVDFNPPLDEALDTNAFGAQNLVELARALGDAPLLHTSTCYVVGNRNGMILEEEPGTVHPFPRAEELGRELWDPEREIADCLDLIAQARSRCEDAFRQSVFLESAKKNLLRRGEPTSGPALEAELKNVKRKFVSDRLVEAGMERATHWGWPNIYTYTKSIGEQIIAKSGLPYTIARPACCESTREFPFPAWNEGIGTSAPLIFLAMKGQHQIIASDVLIDFVPTDLVCSGMILTLAELLEGTQKPVYQYGASDVNGCSILRYGELVGIYRRKYYLRTNKGNPFLNFLQAHYEPALVSMERYDLMGPGRIAQVAKLVAGVVKDAPGPARPAGKAVAKTLEKVAAQEERIDFLLKLFAPFIYVQKGPFSCANTRAAYARLSDADKQRVPWEPEKIDWADYWMNQHMPAMEKRVIPWLDERYKREVKPLKPHETLASLVDQMAERHEHAPAFQRLEEDGLARVTYADVQRRADAAAARLARLGVQPGDRVVLSAQNHPDWPIAYFAIVRAGAAVVPVDPALEAEPFENVVRQSEARVVIWDAHVDKHAGALVRDRVRETHVICDLHDVVRDPEPGEDATRPAVEVTPDDVASVIFTSGTTGTPKGVLLTHKNFTSMIAALAPLFPLSSSDRVLSVLPLHHTFEFSCGMLLPFSRGARVAYLDELNGERLTRGLKEGRITGMVGVPAVWQLLERRILGKVHARGKAAETVFNVGTEVNRFLAKNAKIDLGRLLFGEVHAGLGGHVRWLISGGAALPPSTHKLFQGLGLKLTEGYGLTEAAPVLTVAKAGSAAGQVGKPVPGVEIKIASPDEQGVGEVLARGPNVMAGYTDREATELVLDADGWLHTGDLGKLDKRGRLVIVGRSKDVIVTASGENIYPDDLEKQLGPVKHVEELAFVGVEAKAGGERLACLAVPAEDDSVDRATRLARADRSLRDALGKLPFGKQPSVIHLYDARLPRTATRKVKRNEVKDILRRIQAATQRPTPTGHEHGHAGEPRVSAARHAIAGVKNRAAAEVTADMSLADDLGFDSLALTELLVALEARYGTIDPKELQACRTVADVEALCGAERQESRTRIIEGREKEQRSEVVRFPKEIQDAGKRAIGKLQDLFYGGLMSSEVTGQSFIPHNRNVIVVANHASHLDMGFVRHALGRYGEDVVTLAAQDYFFERGTLPRTFFENFTNLHAIDRKGGLRASERQAGEILQSGKTMLIFPEGTRSPDGRIHEFKAMVGQLALTYGVDILPLWVTGTRDAMPKGAKLPTSRRIKARIGPAITVRDMRRLTDGMSSADAAREVAKLAHRAVLALEAGDILDVAKLDRLDEGSIPPKSKKKEHPLVTLFQELEGKFAKGQVDKPTSFYFTLGTDPFAKWTVLVDPEKCEIKLGKPESGTADCVLKTSPELFTKIVREAWVPGPAEFISGALKSNDVSLLLTFQKVFQLS